MIGTAEKGPIALTPNVQRDYALSLVKALSTMDIESVSNGTQMSDNIRGGAFKIISLTEVEPPTRTAIQNARLNEPIHV